MEKYFKIYKKLKVGDSVHVKSGIINYIGKIESIFQNPGEREVWYVSNGHCYSRKELKKVNNRKS